MNGARPLGVSNTVEPRLDNKTTTPKDVISHLYRLINMPEEVPGDLIHIVSCFILNNYDAFVDSDKASSCPMSAKLQEAIVLLIMRDKKDGDLLITRYDIVSTLENLKKALLDINNNNHTELTSQIATYLTSEQEFPLEEGVQRYNDKLHHSNSQVILEKLKGDDDTLQLKGNDDTLQLKGNDDSLLLVTGCLSLKDSMNLLGICRSHLPLREENGQYWTSKLSKDEAVKTYRAQGKTAKQIFLEHPECRLPRYLLLDQKGRDYFANTLGCGFVMVHKIELGECTIEEVLERREEVLAEVRQHLSNRNASESGGQFERRPGGLACLISGALTFEQVDTGPYVTRAIADVPFLYKYFVNGMLKNNEFVQVPRKLLSDSWIQEKLDSGKMNMSELLIFRERNNQHFSMMRIKPLIRSEKLVWGGLALLDKRVQKVIDEDKLSLQVAIEVLRKESEHAESSNVGPLIDIILTLSHSEWLQQCHQKNEMVWMPWVVSGGIKVLSHPQVQHAIDEELLTLEDVKKTVMSTRPSSFKIMDDKLKPDPFSEQQIDGFIDILLTKATANQPRKQL